MRVRKVLIRELLQASPRLIPPSIAVALTKNPCAHCDDVALLVAYHDEQPVGFLGLVPGEFRHAGMVSRVHWLSSWYVATDQRHTGGAGSMLMMAAMRAGYDLVASAPEMAENARAVYRALGFAEVGPIDYVKIDFDRLDPTWAVWRRFQRLVAKRGKELRGWAGISRRLLRPVRRLFFETLSFPALPPAADVHYVEVLQVTPELIDQRVLPHVGFSRSAEVLNWMVRYPWPRTRSADARTNEAYADGFGAPVDSFRFVTVRLEGRDDRQVGFAIMSLLVDRSKRVVKLVEYAEPALTEAVGVVFAYAKAIGATQILLPGEARTVLPSNRVMRTVFCPGRIFCFVRPRSKQSPLASENLEVRFSDGDVAFT